MSDKRRISLPVNLNANHMVHALYMVHNFENLFSSTKGQTPFDINSLVKKKSENPKTLK